MKAKLLRKLRKEAKETIYMVRKFAPVSYDLAPKLEIKYSAQYFIVFKSKDGSIGYKCGRGGDFIKSRSYEEALALLQSRRIQHVLWLLAEKYVKKMNA